MDALDAAWIGGFREALNGKYDSVDVSEKNSMHLACIGTLRKNGLFFSAQIRHGCTGYKDQYVLNAYCSPNKKLINLISKLIILFLI